MVEYGLPLDMIDWIVSFLSDRVLCLGRSSVRVFNGLPQGSCLSPILFNLYSASLHKIEDENTMVFQFADDFIIMSFDRVFDCAVFNLTRKISEFVRACDTLNMSLNIDKTRVMYFAKGSRKSVNVSINGRKISQVSSLHFLGRRIMNSLSVKEHYEYALRNCDSAVNLLKCLGGINKGLRPDFSLNFYKSFIRSKIEYARTSTAHSPCYINRKIKSFQNSTIRRCLGLTTSTPVHVIYSLACELPPEYRAILLTVKELLRIHIVNPSLFRLISENRELRNSYSFVWSQFGHFFEKIGKCVRSNISGNVVFKLNPPFGGKNLTPPAIIRNYYRCVYNDYVDLGFIIMSTDASLADDCSGCAVYHASIDRFFLFRCDFRLSSLSAELIAIREALLVAICDGVKKLVIFSDSKNSLLAISNNRWENCLVSEIIQIINSSSFVSIHFVYVPSHVGVSFNERADELAKLAVENGAPVKVDYSSDWILNLISKELWNQWNHDYSELS